MTEDIWEARANRYADRLSVERKRTVKWVNIAGLLAVLFVLATCVAVGEGLYYL